MIKKFKNKRKAQTMVEFALVLPILMMLIFGILEVGRMVFIYVTVSTASREAVRYGSATGLNDSGGITRYKDCNGIRAAAQKVNFLGAFDPALISISYDDGDGNIISNTCPPPNLNSGDRIHVEVKGDFVPIVKLIPLLERSVALNNPITSSNYHTILGSVSIRQPGDNGEGCTDVDANNFDPTATIDNGSCTYDPITGCTDPAANNFNPDAAIDDDSCTYNPIAGCMDPTANNFNSNAAVDDGSCTYGPIYGCMDSLANNYNPHATLPTIPDSCTYTDLCDNIDGNQATIPGGYYLDANGTSCVANVACTFHSNGNLPQVIAKADSNPVTTNWIIYNTSNRPLFINSFYITWTTQSKLYLTAVRYDDIFIYPNINIYPDVTVSGYDPMPVGETWTVPANSSIVTALTFEYKNPPDDITVASKIQVTFNQTGCIFSQDPLTFCYLPNMLSSDCAKQKQ